IRCLSVAVIWYGLYDVSSRSRSQLLSAAVSIGSTGSRHGDLKWKRRVAGGIIDHPVLGAPRPGGNHGRTVDRIAHYIVRARRDTRQALQRDAVRECHLLQPAAQGLRLASAAAIHLSERRL